MKEKTLYDLKVGDWVVIRFSDIQQLRQVTRTTDTFIIIDSLKFRKKDGFQAGQNSKWIAPYIVIASDEMVKDFHDLKIHTKLVQTVMEIPFQSLTNNQLRSILNIALEKND